MTCRRMTGTGGGGLRWPGRTRSGRFLPRIGEARDSPVVVSARRQGDPPRPGPIRRTGARYHDRRLHADIVGVGCRRPRWTPTFIITRPPDDLPAARRDRPPRTDPSSGTILATG